MKDTRFTVSRMPRRDQVERNLRIYLEGQRSEVQRTWGRSQRIRGRGQTGEEIRRTIGLEEQRTRGLTDQSFRRQKAAFGSVLKIGKPEVKESRGKEDTLKDPLRTKGPED